jgi:pimeloyl-ACP methyl ester carboxylesterase
VPVVLIPGVLGKWGFMKHLGDQISLLGHPVYVIPKLGYNVFSIPTSAQKLKVVIAHVFPSLGHTIPKVQKGAEHVKALLAKENLKGVVLVAHSKGGLIGKYFLAHYNSDQRVLGMVAVATPFTGSRLAKFIPITAIKEMQTDSKIIHDLEAHTKANQSIISIIPEYDNHVWAEKGSFLAGAQNIEVLVHGHHKALFDKQVIDLVLKSIEKISAR